MHSRAFVLQRHGAEVATGGLVVPRGVAVVVGRALQRAQNPGCCEGVPGSSSGALYGAVMAPRGEPSPDALCSLEQGNLVLP